MAEANTLPPPRGFPDAEFEARLARAQRLIGERAIDALLLTTEPEVRYFTPHFPSSVDIQCGEKAILL